MTSSWSTCRSPALFAESTSLMLPGISCLPVPQYPSFEMLGCYLWEQELPNMPDSIHCFFSFLMHWNTVCFLANSFCFSSDAPTYVLSACFRANPIWSTFSCAPMYHYAACLVHVAYVLANTLWICLQHTSMHSHNEMVSEVAYLSEVELYADWTV